jgi:pimeloyl-ACP methyl ester carboxylesterase
MTETVRSNDGTAIAFDRVGEGPALIVVSGALSDRNATATFAPALAEHGFTAVSYDRRGRGESGDTPPFATEREIEDLAAVVVGVGGSASVLGHSSGAVLALDAAQTGIGVERLAVYEPPMTVDDEREPLPGDYLEHLEELIATDRRGEAVAYFLTVGVGIPIEVVDGMREGEMWPYLEALAPTIPNDGRFVHDLMQGKALPQDRWAKVTMPVLVLEGGESPPWIRNAAHALADLLPDARLRTLEGQDHGAADDVLVPEIVAFLRGS